MKHSPESRGKKETQRELLPSDQSSISAPPYSHGCINTNIEKARKYSRFAVDKHYLPITPHIYFTQFMDDTISEERETAVFMNFVLMSKCVELWVFGDTISAGMKAEIERAERKHMKIRYFTEELEEKK